MEYECLESSSVFGHFSLVFLSLWRLADDFGSSLCSIFDCPKAGCMQLPEENQPNIRKLFRCGGPCEARRRPSKPFRNLPLRCQSTHLMLRLPRLFVKVLPSWANLLWYSHQCKASYPSDLAFMGVFRASRLYFMSKREPT